MRALAAAASLAVCGAAGLSGCASRVEAPRPRASAETVVNPPRSERGNPPFYDVLGKRYFVLSSSEGYVERGIASWYGPDFHKQMTSSGDRYDMYGMTAAHRTLPLPTWVEVTNLENGRSVIVKVNDRGPFVDDRIIDLSYGAAKALDMIRAGTARVEVRALGTPEPKLASSAAPAAAPTAPTAPTAVPPAAPPLRGRRAARRSSLSLISEAAADELSPEERAQATAGARQAPPVPAQRLFVQVGAFSSRENAARLVEQLKASGYRNAFVVAEGDGLNRVRVGPLSGPDEYDRVTGGLRALGVRETRLVVQ